MVCKRPFGFLTIQRLRMVWANQAALWVWAAPTLDGLLNRDFSQVSASTQARLLSYLEEFRRGANGAGSLDVLPPRVIRCRCSACAQG